MTPHEAPRTTAPTIVRMPLREAVAALRVQPQSHWASYDRNAEFGTWASQGSGCDTRAAVLKQESMRPVTTNYWCTVSKGKWWSFYNARYYYNAYGGILQIDHVVPVENAWVSGAWAWSQARRVAYYNDLGDPRTLVAVDRADNEAKGDSDVSEWLPSHGVCQYVRYWVAVKTRWSLTVTSTEKSTLTSLASTCFNRPMRFVIAR